MESDKTLIISLKKIKLKYYSHIWFQNVFREPAAIVLFVKEFDHSVRAISGFSWLGRQFCSMLVLPPKTNDQTDIWQAWVRSIFHQIT